MLKILLWRNKTTHELVIAVDGGCTEFIVLFSYFVCIWNVKKGGALKIKKETDSSLTGCNSSALQPLISEHSHFSFFMQRECSQVKVPCIMGQAPIFNWRSQGDEDSLLERRLDPLIVQVPYKPKGWVTNDAPDNGLENELGQMQNLTRKHETSLKEMRPNLHYSFFLFLTAASSN